MEEKKKEQIEKLAKDIEDNFVQKCLCGEWYDEDYKYLAKALIDLKYQKIDENQVVICKEEYEDLVEAKRQLGCYIEDQKILLQRLNSPDPFWFCSFGGCEGVCKECKDTCEMSIFVKERKKAVEEVIKELLNIEMTEPWKNDELTVILGNKVVDVIDKFMERYSINIDEVMNGKEERTD